MIAAMDWERDAVDWPCREFSRRVRAGGLLWHVQVMGKGPPLLLLHGTGASSHSWRSIAPRLSETHTVIVPDLPGHGFTSSPSRNGYSLPAISSSVAELLDAIQLAPVRVAGHSAGAAILVRMALDRRIAPDSIVSFNGAFFPLGGMVGNLFTPLAKVLALNPLVPWIFSKVANQNSVARMIADTGSVLDQEGLQLYCKLIGNSCHAAGALNMMAAWELEHLVSDLPRLKLPLYLVAATNDRTISPSDANRVAKLVPSAVVVNLPGLGHLAHEEDPHRAAEMIANPLQLREGAS